MGLDEKIKTLEKSLSQVNRSEQVKTVRKPTAQQQVAK